MDGLPYKSFLSFNPNQLIDVRTSFGYDKAETIKEALDLLEKWIQKQNHFVIKKFDRNYLERCLIASKGSTERAKQRLDKICTFRSLMPELLQNIQMQTEFKTLFECLSFTFLPKPTKKNYRICLVKVYNVSYEKVTLLDYFRYMMVVIEYFLTHDYSYGLEFILDLREAGFGILSKFNLLLIQKAMVVFIEGYGMRIKSLHLLNASKFVDTLASLIKQGLGKKIGDRLQVHSTMENVYKYFEKDGLPSDYGGKETSLKELHDKFFKTLCSEDHTKHLKETQKAVTDEKCRSSAKFNEEYSGMPGSFKAISFD